MSDSQLISKLLDDEITGSELELLREQLMRMSDTEYALFIDNYIRLGGEIEPPVQQAWADKQSLDLVLERIKKGSLRNETPVHFLKTSWFRYAAAIIILFGIGVYLWTNNKKNKQIPAITRTAVDIAPGKNGAILTLADNSQVLLDTIKNSVIALQRGITAKVVNGTLLYEGISSEVVYNTMSTPNGRQYHLTLPDGTGVWLNAASSIRYPTVFAGNARVVTITGEAYFEVAKNKEKSFIVTTVADEITVLGTSFNVNSYTDEAGVKTSLLEGSIKVGNKILRPGQAFINGNVIITNAEQDIAWKNGAFNFHDMDLRAALRQLGRWYNVKIRYEGGVPQKKLRGKLGRDLDLSQVLEALHGIGINAALKADTLIVSSY